MLMHGAIAGEEISAPWMAAEEAIASLPMRLARAPHGSRLSVFRKFVTEELQVHVEFLIPDQAANNLVEIAHTHGLCGGDEAENKIEQMVQEAFTPQSLRGPQEPPAVNGPEDFDLPAECPGGSQDDSQGTEPATSKSVPAKTGKTLSTRWRKSLIASKEGAPKGIAANAITAFRLAPEWQGVLTYDEFAMSTMANQAPPWEGPGPVLRAWLPLDDVLATNWLQHNGITVGLDVAQMAVEAVAQDAGYHPVKDYLNGLTWDGKPRVATWLTTYLGVSGSPYSNAVGERFLISAVARVMQPGCKADAMLIIEGPQGVGKSRAIHSLVGKFYSDELSEIGTKDASLQLRGAWIFELSELDAMQRSEIGKIKAFLSRKTDRFRPPYGKRVIEAPRQCVFVGTTNSDAYLKDETGARRFWPVKATKISPEAVERDRDQLWAEAVRLYRAGRPWWIDDPSIATAATAEQDDRYSGDPWDDLISRYVEVRTEVSVDEILRDVIGIPINEWSQANQNRVARSLKSRKWVRFQKRTGKRLQWLYRRND